MIDFLYTASIGSPLGQALLSADEDAQMKDFLPYLDVAALQQGVVPLGLTGRFKVLLAGESDTAIFDGIGERHPVNRFCEKVVCSSDQVARLLGQIVLARRALLDADAHGFLQGTWLKSMGRKVAGSQLIVREENREIAFYAYQLLASLEADHGASPVFHDGNRVLFQMQLLEELCLDGDQLTGWPKERSEFLVITGFKAGISAAA